MFEAKVTIGCAKHSDLCGDCRFRIARQSIYSPDGVLRDVRCVLFGVHLTPHNNNDAVRDDSCHRAEGGGQMADVVVARRQQEVDDYGVWVPRK